MPQFVHLHTHSHYSLLDGLGSPARFVDTAANLEQPAVALTDHGSLSGAMKLWKAGNASGVKPIVGVEAYVAPEGRHHKLPVDGYSGNGAFAHLTLLAEDATGVRNLFRMQAEAHRTGFYRRPRIDLELLAEHSSGVICLTGCPSSILSHHLRRGQWEDAREHVGQLRDIFGDRLYVEVMYHGIATDTLDDLRLAHDAVKMAGDLNLPVVATVDAHYPTAEDSRTHSALLCVQTHSTLKEPAFAFDGSGYHILSGREVARSFTDNSLPVDAVHRTVEVAERVGSYDDVFSHQLSLPSAHTAEGVTSDDELAARLRLNSATPVDPEYARRLRYEFDTITGLGFSDYFLVLSDVINEAKAAGIRIGPGRGSAGGSLVAYELGITQVDPLQNGLLFERFLNPDRPGLPDIDVDVAEDRRADIIDVARRLYGDPCVAMMGTFGTTGAKAALKDAARVLGYPYSEGERRSGMLPPPRFGRAPDLTAYDGPKDDIYDVAVGLEGTVRSESIHAAGVIISPVPLESEVPLRYPTNTGPPVIGLEQEEVEALGFVKFDFLGLRTLKVIEDCVSTIGGQDPLPTSTERCDDPEVLSLFARGDTLGVFQMDSDGMRGLLRKLRPQSFADVVAAVALYRPGPMGAGAHTRYANRQWESIHPELDAPLRDVLKDTYGLVIYQEQVLEVLATVGGYTYASAELIFNAMRKKDTAKMEAAKPELIRRMAERGYSDDAIEALWEVLVPFADYSFNKAHATAYGLVAYWTAYLKTFHPAHWMAALLSNEPDPDKLRIYLAECQRMGIEVLPPCVNESNRSFTPLDRGGEGAVRYGLSAIKGIGDAVVERLISGRRYRSRADFYRRAPREVLHTGVLAALIRSGALDGIAPLREGHVASHERLAAVAATERRLLERGQRSVATERYNVKQRPVDPLLRRQWERETIGVALSPITVVVHAEPHHSEPEWQWLHQQLPHVGTVPVKVDVGGGMVVMGWTLDPEKTQKQLASQFRVTLQ